MGLFTKRAHNDPDPHPGVGGYDTPRGPVGRTGLPGSTASTRQNPQAAADKLHNGPLRPQPIGGRSWSVRRLPTITAQQANVIPGPAVNNGLPFHGPDSKTNPDRVRDTEHRPRIVVSRGIPGAQNQRNSVYYGGAQAVPGAEHAYKPASKVGKYTDFSEASMPSRYVFGGVNGGTDNLDDMMVARRMPYTGHGAGSGFGHLPGYLSHARGSVRGAVLNGDRFYQAPDTQLNQGGAYGQRVRGQQRHRPTIFSEPANRNARHFDTTADAGGPDVPGRNSQVVRAVYVSPQAGRKGWRRHG